jgi:hypothetical protein
MRILRVVLAAFPVPLTLAAIAVFAPSSLFALGRDLTTMRMVTPEYSPQSIAACATEKGFLIRWSSGTLNYGTTADSTGVPRLPATSLSPFTERLFPNGDGCIGLSQNGIAELNADGTILRSARFATETLTFSRAAFDGTNFFLFKVIVGSGYYGLIVDRNGHVLSTTKLPIVEGTISAIEVAASADGGFTLLAGAAAEGIYALRISAAGNVTGKVNVALGNEFGGYIVAIATNTASGQTVAAWSTLGSAFVHTAALHGESAGADVILPSGSDRSARIVLLPSGGGFILVRNATAGTQSRLLASRLDGTGAPRDASAFLLLNGSFAAAATTRNTLVLLAFGEGFGNLIEVSAAISDDTGINRSATYDVLATAVGQTGPMVASDGVDFFGVWLENTATTNTIMAGRVTRAGQPLDGTGLVVAESPASVSSHPLYGPAVAFGAGVYLVVFGSDPSLHNDVLGRRYARDGTPIDPAPFVISRNAIAPSVAFGGDRFLVAWVMATEDSLGGRTVGSDGSMGTEQLLTPARSLELFEERGPLGQPMISWNGRHFIVAYFMVEEVTLVYRVRVLRTSPLGTPLDAHTTEVIKEAWYPAIACSEQECVVSVLGREIIRAAVLHDETALRVDAPKTVASQLSSLAAMAFDGASYILAWRSGDSLIGVARITRGGQPYGVAMTGTAKAFPTLNPNLVPNYSASPPSIAANSAGDTAIVTTEFNSTWMIDRARFYFASEFLLRKRASAP